MLVVTVGRGELGARLSDVDFALMVSDLADCISAWEKIGPPNSRTFGVTDFMTLDEMESCVLIWFEPRAMSGGTDDCLARFAREYGVPVLYGLGETFAG